MISPCYSDRNCVGRGFKRELRFPRRPSPQAVPFPARKSVRIDSRGSFGDSGLRKKYKNYIISFEYAVKLLRSVFVRFETLRNFFVFHI